ncbi:unnamed protein product [Acanthoscelides obtectus]|uniref:Uncharacterized protein n=1 Tax=Acanthoscelides obtectus TaxID=200917 RepID=A0A9P0L314_ACAOB|nr:unnamed protein product [Acanthoscelides obtectus]CAK1632847.1 hypothetical protein AOBTE_LOCUS7764 [Acanthoscelides obtectus]
MNNRGYPMGACPQQKNSRNKGIGNSSDVRFCLWTSGYQVKMGALENTEVKTYVHQIWIWMQPQLSLLNSITVTGF